MKNRTALLLLSAALVVSFGPAPYDLILQGGHVLDGTGNPWFRADVAVVDGRIGGLDRFDHGAGRGER